MEGWNVSECLQKVFRQIEEAKLKRTDDLQGREVRLLAVSKIKPVEYIIQAYNAGQKHFGENYVQELHDKATDPKLLEHCKDIKWHLIGHLQSNKVNKVLSVPNLWMIESIDSIKLATQINKAWPNYGLPDSKLDVMIQVNTSRETVKSGCETSELTELARHILNECPNLRLDGLMTIGKYGYDPTLGPNPDYVCLRKCRDDLCDALNLDSKEINLSMGMSNDFEQAIELGSTHVRVGQTIFGERPDKAMWKKD
ncbi:pyridoxal phosphate homeostasis protein-like [Anthonomus grandis grandis]|uniref:pyridoxal phosphate homeostasis protein-like n=1 Tax=Anthonomus grandis grandis TaxID=2921223 RepID=UPI002165A85C|nr:pyridoxal phosphate homeostasis protein-like [Anthonomus grandis grandis]